MFNGKIELTIIFYKLKGDIKKIEEIKDYSIDYNHNEDIFYKNKKDKEDEIMSYMVTNKYSGFYSSKMMNHNKI